MSQFTKYFQARYNDDTSGTGTTYDSRKQDTFHPRTTIRINKEHQDFKAVAEYIEYLVYSRQLFNEKELYSSDTLTKSVFELVLIYLLVVNMTILTGNHQLVWLKMLLLGSIFYMEKTFLSDFSFLILLVFYYVTSAKLISK